MPWLHFKIFFRSGAIRHTSRRAFGPSGRILPVNSNRSPGAVSTSVFDHSAQLFSVVLSTARQLVPSGPSGSKWAWILPFSRAHGRLQAEAELYTLNTSLTKASLEAIFS